MLTPITNRAFVSLRLQKVSLRRSQPEELNLDDSYLCVKFYFINHVLYDLCANIELWSLYFSLLWSPYV